MIATCTKCRGLYEAEETKVLEPTHLCPRCITVTELLDAATALHSEVRARLQDGMNGAFRATRLPLDPLVERAGVAIDRARAAQ